MTLPRDAALTQLVLQNLRTPARATRRAAALGLAAEELAHLTEVFVNAGARGLAERPGSSRWLSWGVSLKHSLSPRPARFNAARAQFVHQLHRAATRGLADGRIRRFYFMQKPPGLRVRMESRHPRQARAPVERWLVKHPFVRAFDSPVYEPEEYQFGGERGMDIAHSHFEADSLAALEILHRQFTGELSAQPEVLSVLCMADLLRRLTGDDAEVWEVWRRLHLTGRIIAVPARVADGLARELSPLLEHPAKALARLARADRRLVERYAEANATAAKDLRRASARRELLFGPRQLLPYWIIFHWNRWGFSWRSQVSMAVGAERALDPKR